MIVSPKSRGVPSEVLQDASEDVQAAFGIVSNFMSDAGDNFDALNAVANDVGTETDWITLPASKLLSGWVNFGPPYAVVAYMRDASGWVRIRGEIRTGAVGSAIFVLPDGFRPADRELFGVFSNSAIGACTVWNDGQVVASEGSNVNFTLSGIGFQSAPKRRTT